MIKMLHSKLKGKKIIAVCSLILCGFFMVTLFAPWLAPNDPITVNIAHKLQPPSLDYPLGTDHLGRCTFSRILYGARTSLGYAILIFLSALGIGLVVGTITGYLGGWLDQLLMRVGEGLMAIPSLLFVIGFVGIWGTGIKQVILGMILVQWVYYARVIRGMVLSLREQNYVLAARVNGSSPWKIIKKHIIPNVIPSLAVMGTLEMGWAIMNLSSMSFLGLGVQPPTPEWGAMILEGKSYIRTNPELMIYPGLMILLIVITFNLLGETLSEKFGVKRR
ncbi:nickel ABC transporter permease subunit NikC [Niallia taxi]|uniref:nickel ABC transporter permease subunit NikC n=1 Tax=Niallia taxi TaxID=2499688 RepID=UPI0011A3E0C1|nr:nickel ABC transporter permease subunit NikC [Niallia taxi]MCT2346813.1 nickel ABC transporter permease subunit NikC [Niallia taxi]MDE5052897.1 nickel ABC transporter permease subunit NikC [Niallia taxi]MED3960900.1 nickel ABC transporter permease subunit NikC [Niallia taxi]WOD65254.1 nickel ABC transporter permease subunit NikC [Niallia taxi]